MRQATRKIIIPGVICPATDHARQPRSESCCHRVTRLSAMQPTTVGLNLLTRSLSEVSSLEDAFDRFVFADP